jgi:hypothetical protein
MARGFPSFYSVLSFDGYDPLVESKPEILSAMQRMYSAPIAAARAYGIQWVVVDRAIEKPLPNILPHERMVLHSAEAQALVNASQQVLQLPEVEIRALSRPCPLAFAERAPDQALPLHLNGAGPTVDLSGVAEGGAVIVNFIAWPDMAASADGTPVTVEADPWGRIRAVVPAGAKQLEVRYRPPWSRGIRYGLAIAVVTLVAVAGTQHFAKRRLAPGGGSRKTPPVPETTGSATAVPGSSVATGDA